MYFYYIHRYFKNIKILPSNACRKINDSITFVYTKIITTTIECYICNFLKKCICTFLLFGVIKKLSY